MILQVRKGATWWKSGKPLRCIWSSVSTFHCMNSRPSQSQSWWSQWLSVRFAWCVLGRSAGLQGFSMFFLCSRCPWMLRCYSQMSIEDRLGTKAGWPNTVRRGGWYVSRSTVEAEDHHSSRFGWAELCSLECLGNKRNKGEILHKKQGRPHS